MMEVVLINISDFIFEKNKGNLYRRAVLYVDKQGNEESWTYRDLDIMSNRVANMLKSHGIKKGDRVFVYLERSPETYFFILGIFKLGAIYCPLFPSFGPDAVKDRFNDCQGSLILAESKLAENVEGLPHILVDREGNFRKMLLSQSEDFETVQVSKEDYAIIHYTSGTTGKPKGAVHCHGAILSHWQTSKDIVGLAPGVKCWFTADPAWVTGTSYGVLGALSTGADILVAEPGYRISQVLGLLEKYEIEIWYTAPTLFRMLMREDSSKAKGYNLKHLKKIFSAGEALNPEVCRWAEDNLGLTIFNHWFQTETGSIIIGYDGTFPKKGYDTMGKVLVNVEAEILDDNYNPVPPGTKGHLALKPSWPSMFLDYWGNHDKYLSKFKNGWYITGDLAYRDEEGYFYYLSREDDVINTAGHLVTPFEVESALMSHPSVAEAAAKGIPDKLLGEAVKAFVVLKEGYKPSPELEIEYRSLVRNRVSPFASPQEIEFMDELPKTETGKIIRRVL